MPVARRLAYFDHAAVAPLSGPALAVIEDWATDAAENGDLNWLRWNQQAQNARRLGAQLIGALEDEVALVHNTTEGIGLVAEGFPWRAGDNVVTLADEFPSNLFPWMNLARRGVEARLVPTDDGRVDLDRLRQACDARTRIVAVSWVGFASGWRNDVAALVELAHHNGSLFFLDAIQGLGVFPLDVRQTPVDFLAADGHKWLLGPEGAGLFYLRREHLDRLAPLGVGWNSVVSAGDYGRTEFQLKPTAARYEGGSPNMGGNLALAASLELLLSHGTEQIAERVIAVTDALCAALVQIGATIHSDRSDARRSGIVAFSVPEVPPQVVRQRGLAAGVVLSVRNGRLRASPHAYVDESDLDRLVEVVESARHES
ncbi:MAG: aminotransferase class V-fold PLP-dependent enzyme [Pirellulales bacterium]|nr:aminotransferase class V-fold PLP-dependent enzyme [Pirellulales bacterium]